MTFKKFSLILLMSVMALTLIVACNGDVSDEEKSTTVVSFAPTVSKALNQEGADANIATNVNSYQWEVYVADLGSSVPSISSYSKNSLPAGGKWQKFSYEDGAEEKGLGVIKGLNKGNYYLFGLRGYSLDSNYGDCVWEGWCYVDYTNDKNTLKAVQLSSKKQLVTINVEAVGNGFLYFNISAPVYADWNIGTTGTDNHKYAVVNDRFVYSYTKMDGTGGKANVALTDTNTEYKEDYDAFFYATTAGTPEEVLATSNYVFTVWQETWDAEANSGVGSYVAVPGRKQIVIARIDPGINTIIAGSLDSTGGLTKINYEGEYTSETSTGILVSFTDANYKLVHEFYADVKEWTKNTEVIASDTDLLTKVSGTDYYTKTLVKAKRPAFSSDCNFDIGIQTGYEFATIEWSDATSISDLKLYVNGDELKKNDDGTFMTTGTNDYFYRDLTQEQIDAGVSGESLVKTSGTNCIVVKGLKNQIYHLTLQYKSASGEAQSVVFSIQGEVVLVDSIVLNKTSLTLTLNPAVKFTDSNNEWQTAVGSNPVVRYFFVGSTPATTGGTLCAEPTSTSTKGYYYAEIYAPGTTFSGGNDMSGTPSTALLTVIPTEVK